VRLSAMPALTNVGGVLAWRSSGGYNRRRCEARVRTSGPRDANGGAALSGLTALPIVWAQATGTNPNSLAPLALRRWFSSATLSSPEAVPSLFGLWSWLAGLAAALVIVMIVQGPARALRQFLDIPAHLRLISESVGRLRRAGRVVAVTIGTTVVAWTAGQIRTYNAAHGRDELILLLKSRSLGELAIEQGVLAGLTPLRDVFSLGNNLPLLIIATVMIFRTCADRWGAPYAPPTVPRPRGSAWANVAWGAGALYLLYRLVSLASGTGDLPMGDCLMVEVFIVPVLMAVVDGLLLGWILVELRNASLGDTGNDALDSDEVVGLLPGSALACVAGLPARYVATTILLASLYVPSAAASTLIGRFIRWQLSWGLADIQAAALSIAGVAGAVAWSRGTVRGAFRGYRRLLATEGGAVLAVLVWSGLVGGLLSAVAYFLVLSLPTQTWVLAAADGYAHYGTLPVGLLALAALVELGERSLPAASLADEPTSS
jgi:hypothetical protein